MSFFDSLRHHAAARPAAAATCAAHRVISYRRLWSRIQRASARLAGEWNAAPGDIVVYRGGADQDALMLYLAAARCGARLLPVGEAPPSPHVAAMLCRHPPQVVLYADGLVPHDAWGVPVVAPLSALVATPTPCRPALIEDETRPSLITLRREADGTLRQEECSLSALQVASAAAAASFHVNGALFDARVLAQVLPVLAAGGVVDFR